MTNPFKKKVKQPILEKDLNPIKQNIDLNKSKILVEVGSIIIGIISICGSYLSNLFEGSNPLTGLLVAGIVAVSFPATQRIIAMIFGVELELKLTKQAKDFKGQLAEKDVEISKRDNVIGEMIQEKLTLEIENGVLGDKLELEQQITEWKLKTCASNDNYRETIKNTAFWNKLEDMKKAIKPKIPVESAVPTPK